MNLNSDIGAIANLNKKSSFYDKINLKQIKENEKVEIDSILTGYMSDICIYDMMKSFLKSVSLKYDQIW